MIIDAHTHSFKDGGKFYSIEDLLASMDEAGIDYSILIADGVILGGTTTEEAIRIGEAHPRIKAVGNVTYEKVTDEYIQTVGGYLEEKKIHGLKFYPGYENFYPTDEKLFPLYALCQKIGAPVIFHTGFLMSGLPGLLRQVQPLFIDDVANAFPNLKIVMAHFGNPWIVDAAAVVLRNKNVYVDLSGYFKEFSPITTEGENSFVQDLTSFKNIVGDFKRCIFASDWPLYSQKEYLEAAKKLPLTTEEKELVFWKNAKEVFRLDI